MCKSICSSIKYYIFCSSWHESVYDETIFQSIVILRYGEHTIHDSISCIGISQPNNTHTSLNMKYFIVFFHIIILSATIWMPFMTSKVALYFLNNFTYRLQPKGHSGKMIVSKSMLKVHNNELSWSSSVYIGLGSKSWLKGGGWTILL